jgi:FMN reductase
MRISVVIGNPSPGGRTTRAAQEVADSVANLLGGADVDLIELAEHTVGIFEWENEPLAELNASVAASDLIVAASPNYKHSYTGLLKAFFDRYGDNGLAGTVTVPVMVGAAPTQALAVEMHMRPLFVALGSSLPTRGLYILQHEIDTVDLTVASWLDEHSDILRRALG